MDALISNFSTIMIAGIILVVIVSNVNRLVGSVLGVAFWLGVAIVGTEVLARGHQLKLATITLSKPLFYGLCGILIVSNAVMFLRTISRLKRAAAEDARSQD
ncbi:MAG: hypothetical protein HYV07_07120 [Deltaproteobacteria bacterium]|nr:hypothetical protein [Deltaproteobacteria bacterium]